MLAPSPGVIARDSPGVGYGSSEWRIPHVGVVILNWKRPNDTRACLHSLRALTYPHYQVVVVDNGDSSGDPASLRREFTWVHFIENGRNLGFAGGSNVGIQHLLDAGVDYVFLLNDDTEVAPDLLDILVEAAETNADIAILGPKICYFSQPGLVWSAGGRVSHIGEPSHLGVDLPDNREEHDLRDVDYVSGCGILVRSSLIKRVGVLDERFFAYFEETEWCARARRAGFRVVYVPRARMWHKIEMTVRGTSPLYLYLMTRNRLLFLQLRGAGPITIGRCIVDLLRTAGSWALQPRHQRMRPYAPVLLVGIRDFLLGRFGRPSAYL